MNTANTVGVCAQGVTISRRAVSSASAWLPMVFLLALSPSVFAGKFRYFLDLSYLLPVLAGWLASRIGPRVIGLLAVASLLAIFSMNSPPIGEEFEMHLNVFLGYGTHSFAVALLAALAFSSSPIKVPVQIFQPKWKPVLWATLFGLLVAAAFGAKFRIGSADDKGEIVLNAGAAAAVLLFATAIRWKEAISVWRAIPDATFKVGLVVLPVLLFAGLAIKASFQVPVFWSLGLLDPSDLIMVLSFFLAAMNLINWKVLAGVFGLLLVGIWLLAPHPVEQNDFSALTRGMGWDLGFDFKRLGSVLVDGLSGALMGAVLSPLWQGKQVAPLRNVRTPVFLAMVLALQFVVFPLLNGKILYLSDRGHGLVGGVAFVAGLVWRGRGLMAPLWIQLAFLLAMIGFGGESWWRGVPILIEIGAVTFAFAFFGLLTNRYEPANGGPDGTNPSASPIS